MQQRPFAFVVLLSLCACSVHIGSNNASSPPAAPRPAPRPAPRTATAPPSPAPPTATATATPTPTPTPTATPTATATPTPNRLVVAGALPTFGGLDTSKLQAISAKAPAGCGLKEVAPGVWVTIDCVRQGPIQGATAHFSSRKLRLVRASRARLNAVVVRSSGAPDLTRGPGAGDALPEAVDLRAQGLDGPIKYQGTVGTCSAHSLSSTVDNALRRAGRSETISPTHVWARYRHPAVDDAISGNRGKALAPITVLPDSSKWNCMLDERLSSSDFGCGEYYGVERGSWKKDAQIVSSLQNADKNGVATIAGFEEIGYAGSVAPEEVMSILASGVAVWAVFDFTYDGWRVSGKDATIKDYEGRDYTHAVTLVAYRTTPKGRQFLIHNSWGESWGDRGTAWISEYMVRRHMWGYRVKFANMAPKDLTDDDCGPDELIDGVTGQCAAICANDARPSNGCH